MQHASWSKGAWDKSVWETNLELIIRDSMLKGL